MAISANLTPSAVAAADYAVVQDPSLGNEKELYLSSGAHRLLGLITMSSDGVVSWEYRNSQMTKTLTGTVTADSETNPTILVGSSTLFTTELQVGDRIAVPGAGAAGATLIAVVDTITNATSLTMSTAALTDSVGVTATSYPSYPILAVVRNELKANAAAVVTVEDLTGTFSPVGWSANTTFNFGAGRAVELTGTGAADKLIDANTLPTVTNAKRGCKIAIVQVPYLADFTHIETRQKSLGLPMKQSKFVSAGMETTRYIKPGRFTEGRVSVTTLDFGADDGIARFAGQRCVGRVDSVMDERITRQRSLLINCVVAASEDLPEGDGEVTNSLEGNFEFAAHLLAPGS